MTKHAIGETIHKKRNFLSLLTAIQISQLLLNHSMLFWFLFSKILGHNFYQDTGQVFSKENKNESSNSHKFF